MPLDIEHQPLPASVTDPRQWSPALKWCIVGMLSAGSWVPASSANILFPALPSLRASFPTVPSSVLALSVSLFILVQGAGGVTFVPFAELYGRRWIYLGTLAVYTVSQIVAATARSIGLFLAMRILGGYASSPLLTLAAGTIADLYEVEERGLRLGIYYTAPLLGPSLGVLRESTQLQLVPRPGEGDRPALGRPLSILTLLPKHAVGGALTQAGSWRVPFYFLTAAGGLIFLTFVLFYRETFRRERSLVWHKARARALAQANALELAQAEKSMHQHQHQHQQHEGPGEERRGKDAEGSDDNAPFQPPSYMAGPALQQVWSTGHVGDAALVLSPLEEHQQLLYDDQQQLRQRLQGKSMSKTKAAYHGTWQASRRAAATICRTCSSTTTTARRQRPAPIPRRVTRRRSSAHRTAHISARCRAGRRCRRFRTP